MEILECLVCLEVEIGGSGGIWSTGAGDVPRCF